MTHHRALGIALFLMFGLALGGIRLPETVGHMAQAQAVAAL
jgi:hypothetical protein